MQCELLRAEEHCSKVDREYQVRRRTKEIRKESKPRERDPEEAQGEEKPTLMMLPYVAGADQKGVQELQHQSGV